MAKFEGQRFLKNIVKNTEYFVILILAIIVFIMVGFLNRGVTITKPDTTTIDTSKIPFPTQAKAEIERALKGLIPFEQSTYQKNLLQRNLFSSREVLSKQAVEKEITDKLRRAQTLFDQGLFQESISICDDILQSDPNREAAKTLKEKAQKALSTTGTDTTVNP